MKDKPKLPEAQQKQLLKMAEDMGLSKAAEKVGINRQTYAVLAAGLPANAMTVLGVKVRLEQLEKQNVP